MCWMMRQEWDYEQLKKIGSHAGQPGHRYGRFEDEYGTKVTKRR
jgi:hypothetical protein